MNGQATPAEIAANYLDAGLSVLPIRADGTKAPACSSWRDYQNRLPRFDELNRWFIADNVGIGIIHGEVSGGTECIDFDTGELLDPFCDEVRRFAPGLMARLTVIQTPRPGYHVIYKCEKIEGNQKLAFDAQRNCLIETRGQGGYTLAPGSHADCHETGRTYEHYCGPQLTNLPTITPEERAVLFRVAATFNEVVDETPRHETNGHRGDGLSPGDDFSQRADWDEILEPHGWVVDHANGDKTFWRRPGKGNGWSATTGCKSKSGNELFYCFSSNASPLKSETTYNKFSLYATLNHAGDFRAAAKQLASDGYGDRLQEPDRQDSADESTADQPRYRREPIGKFSLCELQQQYPTLAAPVVDGLLRQGETANLISVSKAGKSWGVYGLGISVVMGWDWLDTFPTARGKVLLIDNELHRSTLAHRIPKVGAAMAEARSEFLSADEYGADFDIWPLRGNLRTIAELGAEFGKIEPGYYKLVIFDAKYRFALEGVSEVDNAAETLLYNTLDRHAARLNAALLLVHHSSKGNQSDKRVTDVGSGAGAQSRAADCHMILREHTEERHMVLEAAVRSFPPVQPMTLRFDWPVWTPVDLDPSDLRGSKSRQDEQQEKKDRDGMMEIVKELQGGPLTKSKLRDATTFSPDRVKRLISLLLKANQIEATPTTAYGNKTDEYSLKNTSE